MPLGDDFLLQVAPDPQQHLKFILAGRQAKPLDLRVSVINEGRVMRRYGHAAAPTVWQKNLTKKLIEELAVIGVDFALFLEGDECGFPVSAFNQANFGPQRRESLDVGLAAPKICLDRKAGIAVFSMYFFEDLQSSIRIGGAFHVNLNAFPHGRSRRGDFMRQRKAHLAIEIEPELRQFYGDVPVDASIA